LTPSDRDFADKMEDIDFARQDGAAKKRTKAWQECQGDPALTAAYLKASEFETGDQKWWDARHNVTKATFWPICHSEVVSQGLVFARLMGWELNSWHDYAQALLLDKGAGKVLAEMTLNHSTWLKAQEKLRETGHTKDSERLLVGWRVSVKGLKKGERVMESLGVAFKRECFRRAEAMREARGKMEGPWKAYFSLEATAIEEEATTDETNEVRRRVMVEHTTVNVAKAQFIVAWNARRKVKLAQLVAAASSQRVLEAAPPVFGYTMSAEAEAALLSPEPALPETFIAGIPRVPGAKYYCGVLPAYGRGAKAPEPKRQRAESATSVVEGRGSKSGAMEDDDEEKKSGKGKVKLK